MKNHFVQFVFENGDHNVLVAYQSDKPLTTEIRGYVDNYEYADHSTEWEDIIADAMRFLKVETWAIIPCETIKVRGN